MNRKLSNKSMLESESRLRETKDRQEVQFRLTHSGVNVQGKCRVWRVLHCFVLIFHVLILLNMPAFFNYTLCKAFKPRPLLYLFPFPVSLSRFFFLICKRLGDTSPSLSGGRSGNWLISACRLSCHSKLIAWFSPALAITATLLLCSRDSFQGSGG